MSVDIRQQGLDTASDGRLVELARAGHDAAFAILVGRYRREVLSYCRRFEGGATSAEDIFQQALLNAWRAISAGREIDDVRPWLYRIAHNVAVDGLRRTQAPPLAVPDERPASSIEDELEQRVAVRRALAGMAALPSPQREVMLDSTIGGLSYEELAHSHGLSVGAVRGLIYRARSTLRAAAAALTPGPLVAWFARRTPEGSTSLAGGLVGSGSVAVGSAWLKGGAVLVAVGALAGAAVHGAGHHVHRARRPAPRTVRAVGPAAGIAPRRGTPAVAVAVAGRGGGPRVLPFGAGSRSAGANAGPGPSSGSRGGPGPSRGSGGGPGPSSGSGSDGSSGSGGGPGPSSGSGSDGSSGSSGGPGPSSGSGSSGGSGGETSGSHGGELSGSSSGSSGDGSSGSSGGGPSSSSGDGSGSSGGGSAGTDGAHGGSSGSGDARDVTARRGNSA